MADVTKEPADLLAHHGHQTWNCIIFLRRSGVYTMAIPCMQILSAL